MPQTDSTYRLLALCARAEGHPVFYEQLANQAHAFTAWDEIPARAEIHGMAPLLWHHLRQAGIAIPAETERILRGLYLRQCIYNQAHTNILLEINPLFEKAGIRALVLKGLALAYQYYPDPALRPVSDIDLLLKQSDFLSTLKLLAGAGYNLRLPPTSKRLPKSVTAFSPLADGISVQVELHHYDPKGHHEKGNSPDPEFKDLDTPPQAVSINGNFIYTPAYMEMLHYLMRHITKHLFVGRANNPAQLKWTADMISLVERHAGEIDWPQLKGRHPEIIHRLEIFYSLTPPPERLANIIPIKQVTPPSGLDQYPPGWPHQSIAQWKQVGFLRFVWQVFILPSDWWLRLHYGINEQPLFWYRHILYRMQVLKSLFCVLMHKLGF